MVRPGSLSDDGCDASIKYDEDRLKLLRVLASEKIKGLGDKNGYCKLTIYMTVHVTVLMTQYGL